MITDITGRSHAVVAVVAEQDGRSVRSSHVTIDWNRAADRVGPDGTPFVAAAG